jgi:sulfite exporter TauE/SafE
MWTTALIMGLAGSLHCLGMCSPLAMAATGVHRPFVLNRLVYNAGRIFSYGLLGGIVAAFGSIFDFPRVQTIFSLTLGAVLILMGLTGSGHVRIPLLTSLLQRITGLIKVAFSELLKKKTFVSTVALGMVNGLLPCGLTYLALAYCATAGGALDGFSFMLVFGIGTLPVMLGFTSLLQGLMSRFSFSVVRFTSITMVVVGALLITRSAISHTPDIGILKAGIPIVICK